VKEAIELYSEIKTEDDAKVKLRFGTTKLNVLKVLKQLVKEEFLANEKPAAPKARRPRRKRRSRGEIEAAKANKE
jgi:hypothetical protein